MSSISPPSCRTSKRSRFGPLGHHPPDGAHRLPEAPRDWIDPASSSQSVPTKDETPSENRPFSTASAKRRHSRLVRCGTLAPSNGIAMGGSVHIIFSEEFVDRERLSCCVSNKTRRFARLRLGTEFPLLPPTASITMGWGRKCMSERRDWGRGSLLGARGIYLGLSAFRGRIVLRVGPSVPCVRRICSQR